MAIFRSCLCWKDIRPACIASATFLMTTSLVQLMLQLAIWCGFGVVMNDAATGNWLKDYPYFALYIGVAALDCLVILFSMCVLWGETKMVSRTSCFLPLLILMPLYVLYEATANIYYLVTIFGGFKSDLGVSLTKGGISTPIGSIAVVISYWILKLLIVIPSYLTILSTYQIASSRYHNDRHADQPSHHSGSSRGYVMKQNPYESYGKRHNNDYYHSGRRNHGYASEPREYREHRDRDYRDYRDREMYLYDTGRPRGAEYKRY